MYLLALFALGGLVGLAAGAVGGSRAHRARFNTMAVAMLGALLGGLALPRLAGGDGATPLFWLLIAAAIAAFFTAGLEVLRR